MRNLIFMVLLVFIVFPSFADHEIRGVIETSIDFASLPNSQAEIAAISSSNPNAFYGIGWEFILNNVGIGGDYLVDFSRDVNKLWTIAWLSQPLYVSYHPLGATSFIDIFGEAGIGCAGSVFLRPNTDTANNTDKPYDPDILSISIFPFVATGVALNFSGLVVGAKLSYVPWISPPPVTQYDTYPLKNFQVAIFVGASKGSKAKKCEEGCDNKE